MCLRPSATRSCAPAEAIRLGYDSLMQRAARIDNPDWRRSLLELVPTNHALIERWGQNMPKAS